MYSWVGYFCFGTAGDACEMNVSSFTLNKDDDDGEGDAFVGRFSIVDGNATPFGCEQSLTALICQDSILK